MGFLTGLFAQIWNSGKAIVDVISLLVVTPVVAFYILLDWDRMVAKVDQWIPRDYVGDVRQIAKEIDQAIAGFIRGQGSLCLILGIYYAVGLSLVGLNFGLLIGLFAGMRREMGNVGFTEYTTPILTASSPEGARDFLVPSRIHPGTFYALPQAPQQYKQLLMVAGFDRYFQIAPCFRDEDPRADRLPGEFYQLDLEMSFVTQEDVWDTMGPLMTGIFEEFAEGKPVTKEWPRIPYDEAIRKYGSDKPDLRNPIVMESLHLVERLHRRLLDVIKDEFDRQGRSDVNAIQALLLFNIGNSELTAGELRSRGYYLGSNVSYNVKKLVDLGFINHQRSRIDRRSVRISLTETGQDIAETVAKLYERHIASIDKVGGIGTDEFTQMNKLLQRLDRFWNDQILYRL